MHTESLTWPTPFKALVIGASGAIGGALVRELQRMPGVADVVAVSRASHPGFDLQDADSIVRLADALRPRGSFHWIIDATGALNIDGVGPEKALSALDAQALHKAFAINTIGPALLLRQLSSLLVKGDAMYAKLSARVGSITDNRKGGWYGYRAAKAAMNMMLQTAAIELQRRNPQLRVGALQPGTVRSRLSAPFQAGVPELLEPDTSVAALVQAMRALPSKSGAHFIDHRGEPIPW